MTTRPTTSTMQDSIPSVSGFDDPDEVLSADLLTDEALMSLVGGGICHGVTVLLWARGSWTAGTRDTLTEGDERMVTQPQTVGTTSHKDHAEACSASTANVVRELPLSEAQLQQIIGGAEEPQTGSGGGTIFPIKVKHNI